MEISERTKKVAKQKTVNIESVIGIDAEKEVISLYSINGSDKSSINYLMSGFKAKPFSHEFYDKLGSVLGQFREDHPNNPMQKVTIVLPDSAVLTDMINLPAINKKAVDSSLAASLSNVYGNSSDIKFNRMMVNQSKQMVTYAISGVRKDILLNLQKACAEHQIGVGNITFASSAATNAAMAINPKLKNASFILLDIDEESAKIIFVVKGKTLGFYYLPFGYKMLYKTRVMAEDLIFDHSSAEVLIMNAKAKAKAKHLALEEDSDESVVEEAIEETDDEELEYAGRRKVEDEDDEEDEELEKELAEVETDAEELDLDPAGKKFKKVARKLPKFMLRPTPTNREGYMYENFRLFVKWTLEFIASNPAIASLGYPEAVYVNMPEEYNFLYDMVNLEEEDNGVRFLPLINDEEIDVVKKNIDLYGGLFTKQFNGFNNFPALIAHAPKHPTAEKSGESKEGEAKESAPTNAKPDFKETLKKILEVIKKIATTEIGGKK